MNRIILLIILICFIPGNVLARGIQRQQMGVLGMYAACYCRSCPDADAGADQLCEVPDGTSDGMCGWTVTNASMTTACDNDPALGCADIDMTNCVVINRSGDGSEMSLYKAYSGEHLYLQFYVKLIDAPSGTIHIGGWYGNDNGTNILHLQVHDSSGWKFRIYYEDDAGAQSDLGGTTISTDTWYPVRIYVHNSVTEDEDSFQWWVDYNNDGSFTDEGGASGFTFANSPATVYFGTPWTATTMNYHITGIKLDDDAMPEGCAR